MSYVNNFSTPNHSYTIGFYHGQYDLLLAMFDSGMLTLDEVNYHIYLLQNNALNDKINVIHPSLSFPLLDKTYDFSFEEV